MNISAIKTLKFLVAILLLLVGLHFIAQFIVLSTEWPETSVKSALLAKFNLEGEMNISAWYTQLLHMTAALLLLLIGLSKKKIKGRFRYHWFFLAFIFVCIAFDEASSLHELAVVPTRKLLNIDSGFLFFAWIIPAIIILCFVSIFYINFWLKLPVRTKKLFTLSLLIFVGGTIAMEMISADYYSGVSANIETMRYAVYFAIEEGMEILGISVFIYSLLDYYVNIPTKERPVIQIVH